MARFLLEIPGNEVPPGARASFLVGHGGRRLRYCVFDTDQRPHKGTVVLLQGRNECIEKYFETVRSLTSRGFTAVAFDWRGQGLSDRVIADPGPGHVNDFAVYVRDLDQVFADVVLPDCRGPYYILAHSTGSLVALVAAPNLQNRVRRMMLIAPLLGVDNLPMSLNNVRRFTGALSRAGFAKRYVSGGAWRQTPFEINVVTSDPERYARNLLLYTTYPQLALGGPTVRWMYSASTAARRVSDPDYMAKLHIPTLFIAAGSDTVVSTRAIQRYAQRLRSADCITIERAQHEVLQETDAVLSQFWAAFDAFIPGEDPSG